MSVLNTIEKLVTLLHSSDVTLGDTSMDFYTSYLALVDAVKALSEFSELYSDGEFSCLISAVSSNISCKLLDMEPYVFSSLKEGHRT